MGRRTQGRRDTHTACLGMSDAHKMNLSHDEVCSHDDKNLTDKTNKRTARTFTSCVNVFDLDTIDRRCMSVRKRTRHEEIQSNLI